MPSPSGVSRALCASPRRGVRARRTEVFAIVGKNRDRWRRRSLRRREMRGDCSAKNRVSKSIPQSLRDSSLYTREPFYFLLPLRQSHKNTASFCGSLIWEGAERSELSPSLPSLCKGGCRAERGGRVVMVGTARARQPLRLAFGNPPPLK